MNPLAFPLLADENIHPDVIAALRAAGRDVARSTIEAEPPFLLVAERRGDRIRMRLRGA